MSKNRGTTVNDYDKESGTLTQIQTHDQGADIVTHFDKGDDPVDYHEVTEIDSEGNVKEDQLMFWNAEAQVNT